MGSGKLEGNIVEFILEIEYILNKVCGVSF